MMPRLILLAVLLPGAAFAQGGFGPLRYDYVSANLVVPELDEIGVEIEISTGVTDDLIVFGRYNDYDPGDRGDLKTLQIGVGHVWELRPNIDFVGSISYADNEIDTPGRRQLDEEGLVLGGHVRGWATERIELNGSVLLDNSTGSDTDTVLEAGLQYFHRSNWSYGGRIRTDDEDTATFVGVRFYFGASQR